ncbi:double-strand siRNA ribonuclease [Coprinopsis cinerea okayama7|uniref:Double-strand siRNA ribonuclease n=1 Tax=Coprinopsis cinerea (strain Okayama-7 / 130 / ATCC MYA-4618 / FGSC 9003) TaxID=240176 RepID=A8NGW3_COPC7|nr:double-strand siRNA ribonuclease [Coprinopsis cinerea okayama7\|eukprot:XP_001833615.2 double-strand siRNA ribonuclease [Coprinopsis cinerea okayama7\
MVASVGLSSSFLFSHPWWFLALLGILLVAFLISRRHLRVSTSDGSRVHLKREARLGPFNPWRQLVGQGREYLARLRTPQSSIEKDPSSTGTSDLDPDEMPHRRPPRHIRKRLAAAAAAAAGATTVVTEDIEKSTKSKQLFDMFLVLDIEGTCDQGSDLDFPNEIIEFPVCLLTWNDKGQDMSASELEVIDEFRSFVRPTWRPVLTDFCKDLTGITQEQVDSAPTFPEVLAQFEAFIKKNGLINDEGEPLVRFCWCTDGPFDIQNFIIKQCFISKLPLPWWLKGNVLDVRTLVQHYVAKQTRSNHGHRGRSNVTVPSRRSLNIPAQLKVLELQEFQGRQHSGIDDTRNIARILVELGKRGVHLLPNTAIQPQRRWPWMGKRGRILEEFLK